MALMQKLKDSFQSVARKYAAPLAAGAAIVAGGCQSARPAPITPPDPAPIIQKAPIVIQPKKPTWKNRSPVTDMFEKNMGTRPPANDNMTEDQRLQYYMTELCFEIGDPNTKTPANAEIQLTLGEIAGLTLMGRPLLMIADDMNVKFCGLQSLPAGVAALYYPYMNTLVTSPARSKQDLMMQISHEMMHAAQDQQGLMVYRYNWDIDSRARRGLATEAAAATAEMLIAYEAKLMGKPDYWTYLNFGWGGASSDLESLALLDQGYHAGIKKGLTHQQALMQGGRAAFENVFNNPFWRNFYLNQELGFYIQDIAFGIGPAPVIPGSYFDEKMLEKAGQVGRSPSFTYGAEVPALDALLEHNPKMKWAFEAVEIERARRAFGIGSYEVLKLMETALADKNPYLGVNVYAVLNQHRNDTTGKGLIKIYRYLYEYMDEVIKSPMQPQPFYSGPLLGANEAPPPGHGYLTAAWANGGKHVHAPGCGCRALPPVPPPAFAP